MSLIWLFPLFMWLAGCTGGGNDSVSSVAKNIPQNIVVNPGTRAVELSWSGVAGASGYTVYWSNQPGVTPRNGYPIRTDIPNLNHSPLSNGVTYYYVVTSWRDSSESTASPQVSAIPQAAVPAAPQALSAQAGDQRVVLRWQPVAGATGYSVYWDTQSAVTTTAPSIDNVVSPLVHSGLQNGQDYYYIVVARNEQGMGVASTQVQARPMQALPLAPVISEALVSTDAVEISWVDVSATAGTQYDLYWNNSGNVSTADASIRGVTSPYRHAPLTAGDYYYRILARNSAGVSDLSNSVHVQPPGTADITPVGTLAAVPGPVSVSIEDGQLSLSWPAATGALAYNLYWTDATTGVVDKNANKIANVQSPYTHIGLNNGTAYRYALSAINDQGESGLSAEVTGTPQVIVPGVPAGIKAVGGDEWVSVSWIPVEDALSYVVYITDLETNTALAPISNAVSPLKLDANTVSGGVLNGRLYELAVAAVNTRATGQASDPVQVMPQEPPPQAPAFLTAAPGDAEVLVQWPPALAKDITDADEAVTGYRVYYGNQSGVTALNGTLLTDTAQTATDAQGNPVWQLRHTGLNNGQRYYYVVTALNVGGESRPTVEAWARPLVPVPSMPANIWAEAGDNQVVLHFSPATDAAITSYNLYWNKAVTNGDGSISRSAVQVITNIQPGYVFTDGNANGNTYYFRLSAVNAGGESALSGEVSATPQVPPPQSAPQITAAVGQQSQVSLAWTSVATADRYVMYWSTDANIDPALSARISDVSQTDYVHTQLNNGQLYYYQVAAVNAGGEGVLSDLAVALPQWDPPLKPLNLVAVPGDGEVSVNWPAVATATSYTLYWHADPVNNDPIENWSSRSGVSSGTRVTGLNNAQLYHFQLQAHNAGGDSPLSDIVSAAPEQAPPAGPLGLSAAPGDGQVSLNWITRLDSAGLNETYTLYWTNDPDPTVLPINSGNAISNVRPTYVHTGLINGSAYRYQLTASNASGQGGASPATPEVSATPAAPPATGVPQSLWAQGGDSEINLSWLPPAGGGSYSYTLYWSSTAGQGKSGNAIAGITSTGYNHSGLSNGQTYYYVVTATDTQNGLESEISLPASATPQGSQPGLLQGVWVQAGDGQNVVYWLSDAQSARYLVEWSTQVDANNDLQAPIQSATVDVPGTQYVHSGLTNSTPVYYRLSGQNYNGPGGGLLTGPLSATLSATPQAVANQPPQIQQGTSTTVTMDEDSSPTPFALTLAAIDNDADSLTWRIASGATNGAAGIIGSNNNATVTYNPNLNWDKTDLFTVEVEDGRGGVDAITVNVVITPQNDAPVFIAGIGDQTNMEGATVDLDASATDVDPDVLRYNASGLPPGLSMNTATGRISGVIDNAAATGSPYSVTLTVDDQSGAANAQDTLTLTWTVITPNAAPTDITLGNNNIAENSANGTPIGTLAAVDSDTGDTHTYRFVAPNNDAAGRFAIVGDQLQVADATLLDYETAQTHTITVEAQDQGTLAFSKDFTITLSDVNDVVPVITNTALSPSIPENSTAVALLTIDDADTVNDPYIYTLLGPDAFQFEIVADQLQFKATQVPDYEIPADVGLDNTYNVSVLVNDGVNLSAPVDFAITVTDVLDTLSATNISAPEAFVENDPAFTLVPIVVSSPDPVTVTFLPSVVAAGSLFIPATVNVTISSNAQTGQWSAIGAMADLNPALAGVTFTPAANFTQNFAIAVTVSDGIRPDLSGSKPFTVTPANIPGGFTATVVGDSVQLSWDTVPGSTEYRVYRSTTAGLDAATATLISPAGHNAVTFTDTRVVHAMTNYYAVASFDGVTESPLTAEQTALIPYVNENLLVKTDATQFGHLDMTSGNVTYIGGDGLRGYWFDDMTFDTNQQKLFGFDRRGKKIVEIDPLTGTATSLMRWDGDYFATGLAFNPTDGLLYACGQGGLYSIHPVLRTVTNVAAACPGEKMVFDSVAGVFLGVTSNSLRQVDPAAGYASTSIGSIRRRTFGIDAIAYFPQRDELVIEQDNYFESVDKTSAAVTNSVGVTGATGYNYIEALAYDSINNKLYGWDTYRKRLFSVNLPQLGAVKTKSTRPGFERIDAVVGDNAGTLYAIDGIGRQVVAVDLADPNKQNRIVKQLDSNASITDLAYDSRVTATAPNGVLYAKGIFPPSISTQLVELDITDWTTINRVIATGTTAKQLTFDTSTGELWGLNGADLVRISTVDGSETIVATLPPNFSTINFSQADNELYGLTYLSSTSAELHRINKTTGVTQAIKPVDAYYLSYMANDGPTLYVLEYYLTSNLYSSDTVNTNPAVAEGSLKLSMSGMTYVDNGPEQTFYTFNIADQSVYALDHVSSVPTRVVSLATNIGSLTYNAVTKLLYGINQTSGELVEINTTTGVLTPLADFSTIKAMAFDSTGQFYVSDGAQIYLAAIPFTGFSPLPATSGALGINALAFDGADNLYGLASNDLISISTSTGIATKLGLMGSSVLAYNPLDATFYTVGGLWEMESVDRAYISEISVTVVNTFKSTTFDNANNMIYVVTEGTNKIMAVDPITGALSASGLSSNLGFYGARVIANNPAASEIYALSLPGYTLSRISTIDNAVTPVGSVNLVSNPSSNNDIVVDPKTGTLYVYSAGTLREINTATAALGVSYSLGQAYTDVVFASDGNMYGYVSSQDQLFFLDLSGGFTGLTATPKARMGFDIGASVKLSYDPALNKVYAMVPNILKSYDIASGEVNMQINTVYVKDFTKDPVTGNLYAMSNYGTHTINPVDGTLTNVGFDLLPTVAGMAINSAGDWYIADRNTTSMLYTVNKTTGVLSPVNTLTTNTLTGIAYHPHTDQFFHSDYTNRSLYILDISAAGGSSLVANMGIGVSSLSRMTYSPANNFFYVSSGTQIQAVDPYTGNSSLLTDVVGDNVYNLEVIP